MKLEAQFLSLSYKSEEEVLKLQTHYQLKKVTIIDPKNIFENQNFDSDTPAKDPIYISETFKVMRISLKKGLEIAPHQGSHPVVFLVLRGKGVFPTDSGERELSENDYIAYSETELRGMRSLEDLTVLAIRN